jgi:uncharacterized protein (UPF0303 family)
MSEAPLKKLVVTKFTNTTALEMGLKIVNLAKSKNQNIAVKIERLNYTIFLHIGDHLPADKHHWLDRKANVAKHFEESSLSVKNDLVEGNMTLEKTFGLSGKTFLSKGGAIPIFVEEAGMVAVITVSGLTDEEDHNIIVEALHYDITNL